MRERTGAGVSNLNEVVQNWQNQDASGKMGGSGGGEFAKEVNNWMSPSAGDAKGRTYTYDQHDKTKPRAALEGQAQSFQSSPQDPATPDGRTCWCGTPGCALPSHKRKLNPIFETWLMSWPLWWLVSVQVPYGPSEMASYLSRQRRHLFFLLGGSLQSANEQIPQPVETAEESANSIKAIP
jgi:hypothetical protein